MNALIFLFFSYVVIVLFCRDTAHTLHQFLRLPGEYLLLKISDVLLLMMLNLKKEIDIAVFQFRNYRLCCFSLHHFLSP